MNAPAVSVKTFSHVEKSRSASLSWLENKAKTIITVNVVAHMIQLIITAHLNVLFTTITGVKSDSGLAAGLAGVLFVAIICFYALWLMVTPDSTSINVSENGWRKLLQAIATIERMKARAPMCTAPSFFFPSKGATEASLCNS